MRALGEKKKDLGRTKKTLKEVIQMADKFLEFARDPGDEEEDDDDEEDTSDDEGWDQREEEIEATEDEY